MTERRRSTGSGVMLLPGRRQCGLCLFTASVTCFATIRVLSGGRTNTVVDGTSQTIQVKANLISLEISGAPRGSSSLARFADGVLRHLVRPSIGTCTFEAFIWMQDNEAEQMLVQLLKPEMVRCISRAGALQAGVSLPLGSQSSSDEETHVRTTHDPTAAAFNTARMLHKLHGVAHLRRALSGGQGAGTIAASAWVIRLRPDIGFESPLALPPRATSGHLVVPWLCPANALCWDQVLLMSEFAARCLGDLYERPHMVAAMENTVEALAKMYPERLIWHGFRNCGIEPTLIAETYRLPWSTYTLLGHDGTKRDPYGKLRSDHPSCFLAS